jgi:hypothetical protein
VCIGCSYAANLHVDGLRGDGKIFQRQADTTLLALDARTGGHVVAQNGDSAKGSMTAYE